MDTNLSFLRNASNDDLKVLVDIITRDKDGDVRISEGLTQTWQYKAYYPNQLHYMVEKIDHELRLFGGNSMANFFRGGEGVSYRELLLDVCDKMKVPSSGGSVCDLEQRLLAQVAGNVLDQMNQRERDELVRSTGVGTQFVGQGGVSLAVALFKMGGFASYTMAVTVANIVLKAIFNRGLSFAGNAALTRGLAIATGPVGWAVTALWTAYDIAGTAYRVTIPAVLMIACMRMKQSLERQGAA